MNDENFMDRYKFFYSEIAPRINLYRIKIGGVFPVMGFTKTGSTSSINMKVYGTYKFKNFENSPLAGSFNIIDEQPVDYVMVSSPSGAVKVTNNIFKM